MKLSLRICINVLIASVLLLVMAFSVRAGISTATNKLLHSSYSSTNGEEEKNITNVKSSYNPVSAQITVSLKLEKQSNIVIKLMDALGNEVLNLSNSTLESGSHTLSFETEGKVAAGFYFVRVSSGSETVVKRISVR